MLMIFALLLWGVMQITPLFNHVKMRGVLPRAYAGEVEKTAVSSRGFSGHVLTGRAELWEKIFEYFRQNPIALLIGESKLSPLHIVNNYKAHCHSIFIQVLLESGIPGLLLFLSFVVYTLIHGSDLANALCLPYCVLLPVFCVRRHPAEKIQKLLL